MKRITVLLFLVFTFYIDIYSCDCREVQSIEQLRQLSYEYCELVFIGKLIDYKEADSTYTFQIIELFKGDYKETIIKGKLFDSCSSFPRNKDIWIVYCNFRENNYIDINMCTSSRSETEPFCSATEIPAPPRRFMNKKEKEKYKKEELRLFMKAQQEWKDEIEWLRQLNYLTRAIFELEKCLTTSTRSCSQAV
ncbi:MAG: hypothetical protein H6Q20_79 [Bacteroidetes bacterium]|nr:hypothetical protein [Bacteroidota bacterium]